MTPLSAHDLFIEGTYSFICDVSHSYVTWLIHMWPDSFICDMTHSYVNWLIHTWHDSFIRDMTYSYVTWLIHVWPDSSICVLTHSYVSCIIIVCHTWCHELSSVFLRHESASRVKGREGWGRDRAGNTSTFMSGKYKCKIHMYSAGSVDVY